LRFLDSYLLLKVKLEDMMKPEEREIKKLVSTNELGVRVYNKKLAQELNIQSEEAILDKYN
jgi:hypothetical protein